MSQFPSQEKRPGAETISAAIARIADALRSASIPDSRIEARTMLMEATGLSHSQVLTDGGSALSAESAGILGEWLRRRLEREPLPYITGSQEFFGRRFKVDHHTLIPRPETEMLVEQALAFIAEQEILAPVIADIGTGSGAIAITLACELEHATVIATDISKGAIAVAQANAEAHGVEDRIQFRHGDLLAPISERCDIVVCNPPYVLAGYLDSPDAQPELACEPRSALDGGASGMETISRLLTGLPQALKASNGAAYIEIDPPIAAQCLLEARLAFPGAQIAVLSDLAGLERCLAIELG